MPACSVCRKLVAEKCTALDQAKSTLGRELPPAPLGACMIPIVEDYLSFISPNSSVLDIGCGSWDLVKKHCDKVGARYEGIDTQSEYFGQKSIATRIENLADLSFADEQFDLVLGNQTMEHWAEHGCSLRWGLYQCFRVCKTNGHVFMNVPIHFHGTKTFMTGDLENIKKVFAEFSSQVELEPWGKPSVPIPDLYPYPGFRLLDKRPAYVLDIRATKNRSLERAHFSNANAHHGRLAQLINYPLSYSVYRVLRKLGFYPKGFKLGSNR